MSPRRSSSRSQKEMRSVSYTSRSSGESGSSQYNLWGIKFLFCKRSLPVPNISACWRPGSTRPSAIGIDQIIEKGGAARVELRSSTQTYVPVDVESDSEREPFRVDVTVPPNAVAMGLYLRLEPPPYLDEVQRSTADLDDLHIIEWAPESSTFSPLYDHFALVGSGPAPKHVLPRKNRTRCHREKLLR